MTHEETVKLFGLIIVAYPNFDKFKDEAHIRATVALWDMMFADDEKWLVSMAVEKHISTSKWPPSIAEIREIMAEIKQPDILPADEAWGLVEKLMHVHESLYAPATAFLPRLVGETVDAVGFEYLKSMRRASAQGHTAKIGLDRHAFIQSYEARMKAEKQQAALPDKLKDKLNRATAHFTDGSDAKIARLESDYDDMFNRHDNLLRLIEGGTDEE